MKKPSKDRRLRKRIIAVFLAAVFLPSLIMAYLGLRYIRQEEQWQEQLVVNNLKVTLLSAKDKIEKLIDDTVIQILDSLSYHTSLPNIILPIRLHSYLSKNPFLDEIFILDNNGRLLFPRNFLRYKPTGKIIFSSEQLEQKLILGEESEARENYIDAIGEYSAGFIICSSTHEKLAFLIRIARCYFKMGNLDEAEKKYRQVIMDDANRFFSEELPYQFIASLQLAKIYNRQDQHQKAFGILLQLYSNMLNEIQRFEQKQFKYYISQISIELQKQQRYASASESAKQDSIIKLEKKFLQEPQRNNFLQIYIAPSIETALRSKAGRNEVRYLLIENRDSLFQVAFREFHNPIQRIITIGLILNRSYLKNLIIRLLPGVGIRDNLQMILLDEKTARIKSKKDEKNRIVEETLLLLGGTVQNYKLSLTGIGGKSINDFESRASIPYFALILFIIVVLALGVIFILHEISREQELARMKSDFISNVTHEIKTPITTIRSLAENVKEGWVTEADKQKDYFRLIARESERLGNLVENTLDFSRIESGNKRFRIEEVSIVELIENIVRRFRTLTEDQEIEISYNISKNLPTVKMDAEAFGQALLNLLDNAAKYSVEKKVIKLIAEMEGNYLKIAVSDRGIGIEKKEISKIFEKFYRADYNTKKNITGSGIGLTIVKEIVEAHNGHIEVVSKLKEGSTFTIFIPTISEAEHG
jgi:two-component system phosphate regulon sensor histidine kinase PhoR